jgi:hypothetical protein
MTEEQARQKWCPMVRYAGEVSFNKCLPVIPGLNCIASDCMMWAEQTTFRCKGCGSIHNPNFNCCGEGGEFVKDGRCGLNSGY